MRGSLPSIVDLGRDLLVTSRLRLAFALGAPFVSSALFFVLAYDKHWVAAGGAVAFLSFITYGSTSHDLVHGNHRLGARTTDALLSLTELLALRSGHAYRVSHLAHHRHFPTDEDAEGRPAHFPLWRVLLTGPVYVSSLWVWAWRKAGRERGWMVLETMVIAAYLVLAVALFPRVPALLVYAILVYMGTWVLPLGLVYVQHDSRGKDALTQTRRFRGRIVHFMVHDRLSFGGSIASVGVIYIWLASRPLARGEVWAFWALVLSGAVGFSSFLSYLGFGYLDAWHGQATLLLLAVFLFGLARSAKRLHRPRALRSLLEPAMPFGLSGRMALGRSLLLFTAGGMLLAGAAILILGSTRVFVPQDLEFMQLEIAVLRAVNARLVPLIAHDRAGYLSLSHLLPAVIGALSFAVAMTLLSAPMRSSRRAFSK
jgi:beta-carotene hydroxylase